MRTLLLIVGIVAILVGALWVGQGTGYIHWPRTSFMINQMQWAYGGAVVAFVGLLFVFFSQRRS
jgi:hypothetical protein